MTKCIVIGEDSKKNKKSKIEFKYLIHSFQGSDEEMMLAESMTRTSDSMPFIELICKKYDSGFDLMFAYFDPLKRSDGFLILGHWNDGIV